MRVGLQNGISVSLGLALAGEARFRYYLPLLVSQFFVSPFSCGSEVPFGQSTPAFFVSMVGVGNACWFRYGTVAKRNGAIAGWQENFSL